MSSNKQSIQIFAIVVMIGVVIGLHYATPPEMRYQHAVYRMLFYLPLVIGSFWFGLKGALGVSGTVAGLYLLYLVGQWKGFSYDVFDKLLEIIIYLGVALIVGSLVEKERRKHRALLRAESLATVGRTVSEVAHDMKTPLIAIGGLLTQVAKNLCVDDPDRKKLDLVIREATCLESMVSEMLTFGRPLELQLVNANLNEVVQESIDIAQPIAKKTGVELKADLDLSLPSLMIDTLKVKQVLLNLLVKAIQASPAGELVLVKTRSLKTGLALEVSDHGSGIKEADQETVFVPFFSTKRRGTGLGLAIVKKIVEAHQGEVFFRPNPEKGVIFALRLPLSKSEKSS